MRRLIDAFFCLGFFVWVRVALRVLSFLWQIFGKRHLYEEEDDV